MTARNVRRNFGHVLSANGTSALGLVLQNVRFVSLTRDTLAGALRCRIASGI
jgi:hypothetical protein